MGLFQRREGPDKVGIEGMGQPIADAGKLLQKETINPQNTPSESVFFSAPIISLSTSLIL